MFIAFLDEFGHIGPFVSRADPKHKTNPIFGIGGFVLPQERVRDLSMWFYKVKTTLFHKEIAASQKHPSVWEKKGNTVFTNSNLRNANIKRAGMRLISTITDYGGNIFYYGREKYQKPDECNSSGLYTTCMAKTISSLDNYCEFKGANLLIIMDQHDDRLKLFASATKTMFGNNKAKRLIEPPLHVESHLYNTVQAADWMCTLLGRLWAFRVLAEQYPDYACVETVFGARIDHASSHSKIWRPRPQHTLKLPLAPAR